MYRLLALMVVALSLSPSTEAATALLTWTPPTQNTDGTPLTDLTSYELWHGCQQSGSYDTVEVILAPAISHLKLGLPDAGSCYFSAMATNSFGVSSDFSNEAVKLMGLLQLPGVMTDTAVTWAESPPASGVVSYAALQLIATQNTFKHWNFVIQFALGVSVLLNDDANEPTGWSMEITDGFGGDGGRGVNAPGTNDAAWVDEANISDDYFFISPNSGPTAELTFSGLNNARTYELEIYGSRAGAANRRMEVSTDDFATIGGILEAGDNNSQTIKLSNLQPSSSLIVLDMRVFGGDAGAYINALRLTEN